MDIAAKLEKVNWKEVGIEILTVAGFFGVILLFDWLETKRRDKEFEDFARRLYTPMNVQQHHDWLTKIDAALRRLQNETSEQAEARIKANDQKAKDRIAAKVKAEADAKAKAKADAKAKAEAEQVANDAKEELLGDDLES